MSDDVVKRAAALVEKQKAWDKWEYPSRPAPPAMVQGEVATLVSDMAAEITRLRAALATARLEGMEEAAQRLEELHKKHNCDPESGALTRKLGRYDRWPEAAKTAKLEHDAGYYRAIVDGVAHIRAAAGERS